MISNSQIQGGWIAKIKTNIAVIALVPVAEIRENMWKGTDFTYPNIRVKLGNLVPQNKSPRCEVFTSEVSILAFTEQKSSKQADDIAGVVAEEFWGKSFTSNGVRFAGIVLDALVPAVVPEIDPNSWMSEVNFTALVQKG